MTAAAFGEAVEVICGLDEICEHRGGRVSVSVPTSACFIVYLAALSARTAGVRVAPFQAAEDSNSGLLQTTRKSLGDRTAETIQGEQNVRSSL